MPVAVGNYWAYSTWSGSPSLSDSLRTEITRVLDYTYRGQPSRAFAQRVTREGSNPPPYEWLYRNGPDGLYAVGGIANTDTLIQEVLFLKYPATVGESWEAAVFAFDLSTQQFEVSDTISISVVATEEPYTTSAGTFSCYVYKYSFYPADDVASYWNVYKYYAPGIGHIADITKSQFPGGPEERDSKREAKLYDYRIR